MDNIIFLCASAQNIHNAYTADQIGAHAVLETKSLAPGERYPEVEAIFSTWGMPALTEAQLEHWFPNLREVYYAAGSVQAFARPLLQRGVRVFSAWAANAVAVAEYTLGQILLANKGYFQLDRRYRTQGHAACTAYASRFKGNYQNTVGLLGAGMVGKRVIENLRPFDLKVMVFDPFLPDEAATSLGVEKASLAEIFENCPVVSNHLANKPETVGILNYALFSRMSPFATFINTGRGAQVVAADLIRAMREEPGRTALLDVTDPDEPLPGDHPLWQVENILITPHRAGAAMGEVYRMGTYMMEEYRRVKAGETARWEVTMEMLKTMA